MSYALLLHTAATASQGGTLTAAGADNVFAKGTISSKVVDEDSFVTLASSEFTLPTGTYRIRARVAFGSDGALDVVQGRTILWSVTAGAIATYIGGGGDIVGTPVLLADPGAAAASANGWSELRGRFEVAGANETFAIYMAGDAATGTWYDKPYAQGKPASGITSGSLNNIYKSIELEKE